MSLQRNGKCDLAKPWYEQYIEAVPDDSRGQFLAKACDSPQIYKDGVIFATERDKGAAVVRTHGWTGNPFLELYYSPTKKEGKMAEGDVCPNYTHGRPEKFSKDLNSKFHEAGVTFANDYKEIYFSRNNILDGKIGKDDEGVIRLKIFSSTSEGDGKWSDLEGLPFNSDEYSVAHPALNADGTKLFFSSDMPGGFGEFDLYVSEKENGRWGPPMNLGPTVNTEGKEVFPSYDDNTGRLYFASDGLVGLGGYDIHYSKGMENGEWTDPVNLGYPMNTISDDFSIVWNEAGTCGYFASDRQGGVGRDDIYSFKKVATPVEVLVYDATTDLPIEGATVNLACNGETMTTDMDGKIFLDLKPNECCNFTASYEDYDDNSLEGCADVGAGADAIMVKIPLTPSLMFEYEGIVYDQYTSVIIDEALITITNDCDGEEMTALTDLEGKFKVMLEKDCCYTIKAAKTPEYLADVKENICTRDKTESEQMNGAFYLKPTGGGSDDPEVPQGPATDHTYLDHLTDNWLDMNTGLIVDGTYPDGRIYERGVLVQDLPGSNLPRGGGTGTPDGTGTYLVHIYYDFDRSYIRDDAEPELQKLLKVLTDNSQYVVEIGSHTDTRGKDGYNKKLSQRRAESVVKWLVKNGIDRDRLVPRGYGESRNVNDCDNNVPCSEREHQLNRRTEFRVIGCRDCVDAETAKISVKPDDVKVGITCKTCPF